GESAQPWRPGRPWRPPAAQASRRARPGGPDLAAVQAGGETPGYEEATAECWFDDPEPGDRRSWAVPRAHGTYQGLDLELLDPGDEDDRALLIEALHLQARPISRRGIANRQGWPSWPARLTAAWRTAGQARGLAPASGSRCPGHNDGG